MCPQTSLYEPPPQHGIGFGGSYPLLQWLKQFRIDVREGSQLFRLERQRFESVSLIPLPRVSDQCSDALLKRCRARRQETAEAPANQDHSFRIDFRLR